MRERRVLRTDRAIWAGFCGFQLCFNGFSMHNDIHSQCVSHVAFQDVSGGNGMTMRAIAEQLGVSIPTLYRKLKTEGVKVSELRDDKTGKVTPAGAAIIADLFRGSEDNTAIQDVLNGVSQTVTHETALQDGDETLTVAVLRERIAGVEERLSMMTAERDRLRSECDRLMSLLEAEQRQRQQLLTDGRGRGLLGWFRRRGS